MSEAGVDLADVGAEGSGGIDGRGAPGTPQALGTVT